VKTENTGLLTLDAREDDTQQELKLLDKVLVKGNFLLAVGGSILIDSLRNGPVRR
jgi:hypothetical protein